MIVLCIDTSAGMSVGLAVEELGTVRILAQQHVDDARHHAERLTPAVEQVLDDAGVDQPDAVVVGTGPAAFTGLRAGLVTARVLAKAWDVPVIGVSSLEVLGLGAADAGAMELVAVIDARRKEVYAQRMRPMGSDDVAPIDAPRVLAPADLAEELRREPAIIAVADPQLYPDVLVGERQVVIPSPEVMTRLALSKKSRQESGENVDLGTEPQYLRRPDVHGTPKSQPAAIGNPYSV